MKRLFQWFATVLLTVSALAVLQRDHSHATGASAGASNPGKARARRRWLTPAAITLGALAIGGLLLAASGIIPIKASSGHWAPTEWLLQFSKERSFATHSIGIKVPPLDDPMLVLKGAGHYETACSPCHGSPIRPQPRVAASMLPRPPRLKRVSEKWDAAELFSIVKHGIKFTGMPAWPAMQRDDEVWAMVAFLHELKDLEPAAYRHLATGEGSISQGAPIEDLHLPESTRRLIVESCARCHGFDGLGRGSGAFPKLAGQKRAYLAASLEAYARGERHSGIMEPIAAGLSGEAVAELAAYYAELPFAVETQAEVPRHDAQAIERGRQIDLFGIPERGVPACSECHGHGETRRNPVYPVLHGQYAEYLTLQLELFQKQKRGGTPYAHLMHFVARRLSPEQMRDVAAYFSSLGPGHHHKPNEDHEHEHEHEHRQNSESSGSTAARRNP